MIKARNILAVVLIVGLSGCAAKGPVIHMNVKAYSDPEHLPQGETTFSVVSLGLMENKLLEKELLHLLKSNLLNKEGLSYAETNPDLIIGLVGYIGSFEKYIPPLTIPFPLTTRGSQTTTASGTVGSVPVYGTSTTTSSQQVYVPITRPGRTVTGYYRNIHVVMGKPVYESEETKVELVWSGTVDSSGWASDLLVVAPALLAELLSEFPNRTAKPTFRRVRLASQK